MSERTIRFDNLHIVLPNVGDHFEIFGFSVMYYGCVIALGMLLAGLFILNEGKKQGFSEDDLLDIVLWTIIWGVVGARIYYVLFSLSSYKGRWLSVFNIREGGLAIYGGIIGGTLAAFIISRKKGLSFLSVCDVCVFGGLIGQILGRWGNFFNREAFGGYYNGLFSMQLPIAALRQQSVLTDEMLQNATDEAGQRWISVHPTFLYESVWNVCVFLILFYFVRKNKKFEGEIFFSYLILYGMGRFWIEGLRSDSLLVPGTELAVSQCLAALCVVVSTAVLYYKRKN